MNRNWGLRSGAAERAERRIASWMDHHRDVDHIGEDPEGCWLVLNRPSVRCREPFARDPRIGVGHSVDPMLMIFPPTVLYGPYSASSPLLGVALLVLDCT